MPRGMPLLPFQAPHPRNMPPLPSRHPAWSVPPTETLLSVPTNEAARVASAPMVEAKSEIVAEVPGRWLLVVR